MLLACFEAFTVTVMYYCFLVTFEPLNRGEREVGDIEGDFKEGRAQIHAPHSNACTSSIEHFTEHQNEEINVTT